MLNPTSCDISSHAEIVLPKFVEKLPNDAILQIFQFISELDFAIAARTCRWFDLQRRNTEMEKTCALWSSCITDYESTDEDTKLTGGGWYIKAASTGYVISQHWPNPFLELYLTKQDKQETGKKLAISSGQVDFIGFPNENTLLINDFPFSFIDLRDGKKKLTMQIREIVRNLEHDAVRPQPNEFSQFDTDFIHCSPIQKKITEEDEKQTHENGVFCTLTSGGLLTVWAPDEKSFKAIQHSKIIPKGHKSPYSPFRRIEGVRIPMIEQKPPILCASQVGNILMITGRSKKGFFHSALNLNKYDHKKNALDGTFLELTLPISELDKGLIRLCSANSTQFFIYCIGSLHAIEFNKETGQFKHLWRVPFEGLKGDEKVSLECNDEVVWLYIPRYVLIYDAKTGILCSSFEKDENDQTKLIFERIMYKQQYQQIDRSIQLKHVVGKPLPKIVLKGIKDRIYAFREQEHLTIRVLYRRNKDENMRLFTLSTKNKKWT